MQRKTSNLLIIAKIAKQKLRIKLVNSHEALIQSFNITRENSNKKKEKHGEQIQYKTTIVSNMLSQCNFPCRQTDFTNAFILTVNLF